MRRRAPTILAFTVCLAAGASLFPRCWLGCCVDPILEDNPEATSALAHGVAGWIESGITPESFTTGSRRFDGEWSLVTNQMAVLGMGQVIAIDCQLETSLLPTMERAVDTMATSHALSFGTEAWGERGLDTLAGNNGHAYLGYLNLALGMLRRVDPETRYAPLHDRLSRALARRLDESPYAMIETYPGESYPPDVSAVVGSLGLHSEASGVDHSATIARFAQKLRQHFRHPESGLLHQAVNSQTGIPLDSPRGSGTALSVYFLSFADDELSRELYLALRQQCLRDFLGFGGICEYPPDVDAGPGDIDSGPVLLGISISATGFAIAGARIHGDTEGFRSLSRTAFLFGLPLSDDGGHRFVSGGALGDAILLAMLTARSL